ncbi:MAG: hypothetical protein AB7G13_14645 [Lautropia sp.]
MATSSWAAALAIGALAAGCGSDDSPRQTYDVSEALQTMFSQANAYEAEATHDGVVYKLSARLDRGRLSYSVDPTGPLQIRFATFRDVSISYEPMPLRVTFLRNVLFNMYADADEAQHPVPTAAKIGSQQTLLKGHTFYYSGIPGRNSMRVDGQGTMSLGWRLEPETDDSAYLCVLLDDRGRNPDDLCYSIAPGGQQTGRFKAVVEVPVGFDQDVRLEFTQTRS